MKAHSGWNWFDWIRSILEKRWELLNRLGQDASKPGGDSPKGKRQNLFEVKAVEHTDYPEGVGIQIEGYPFRDGDVPRELSDPVPCAPPWVVYDDPQGGTVGFSRGIDVGGSVTDLAVGSLLMVLENVPNPTFESLKYAGVLDLRDGTIYLSDGRDAFRIVPGKEPKRLVTKPMYNRHYPIIGTENTRRANSFWSFLIGHPLYPQVIGDSHSTFCSAFLPALVGEVDFTIDANPPGITGGGSRGDDLGAAAVFARAMGAYAVQVEARGNQMQVLGSLDDAPYSFDGLTSVVLAPTEEIATHYLGRINRALLQPYYGGRCVADVLADLYNNVVPDERWKLPIIPGSTVASQ